jgi:NADH-quinone oxidoreductase subunit A
LIADYGYIGLFIIFTVIFSFFIVFLPIALRFLKIVPHNPNPIKNATFECGMETLGKTWVRYNFRFYFYALIFLALDVLVVFLFPWAVNLKGLGSVGFYSVLILLFIVFIGYIYAWRKKVLEWK